MWYLFSSVTYQWLAEYWLTSVVLFEKLVCIATFLKSSVKEELFSAGVGSCNPTCTCMDSLSPASISHFPLVSCKLWFLGKQGGAWGVRDTVCHYSVIPGRPHGSTGSFCHNECYQGGWIILKWVLAGTCYQLPSFAQSHCMETCMHALSLLGGWSP